MPFCPNCKLEYRPGLRRCPDCGADLVDRLESPAGDADRGEDLEQVILCTVAGELHAKLLEDVLASQGILFRAQYGAWANGPSGGLPPPVGGSECPIMIFVKREDLLRARAIYEDFERIGLQQVDWELPPDGSEHPGRCPPSRESRT